jgi:hypothetical protein
MATGEPRKYDFRLLGHAKSATTLNITALSIITFSVTINKSLLSALWHLTQNVVMPTVVYAEETLR